MNDVTTYETWEAFITDEYNRIQIQKRIRTKIRRKTNWEHFKKEYGRQIWIKIASLTYFFLMPFVFRTEFVSSSLEMKEALSMGMVIALIFLCCNVNEIIGWEKIKDDGSKRSKKVNHRNAGARKTSAGDRKRS